MSDLETTLNEQEINWILEQRIRRLTDNEEVLIYPMGAERYLSQALSGNKKDHYNILTDTVNKNILIIPGYGNSAFLFAHAGAKSVTVYDKDPVTIAWIKAFKKYYNYREYTLQGVPYPSIGELLTALTSWYPPIISLPSGRLKNILCWIFNPKLLRRTYIFYMLSLIRQVLQDKVKENFELDKDIKFYVGELGQMMECKEKQVFDTAFVPYLLGVQNGIEDESDIVNFIKQIIELVPKGHILVSPTQNLKEFHFTGKRYFTTTKYAHIQAIPGLSIYFKEGDPYWFRTQGLAVFTNLQDGLSKENGRNDAKTICEAK